MMRLRWLVCVAAMVISGETVAKTQLPALIQPEVSVIKRRSQLQQQKDYSENNAKILANMINTVNVTFNDEPQPLRAVSGYHLLKAISLIEQGHEMVIGAAMASRNREHIVFVFRDAISSFEWQLINNFDLIAYDSSPKLKMNYGIYKAYKQIKPQLEMLLRKHPSVDHVWFAGVGLGGALATVAAFEATDFVPTTQSVTLYTFGAPRVVNQNMAVAINESRLVSYRIVNIADVMPTVPSPVDAPQYQHIKETVLLQYNGDSASANHAYYLKGFLAPA